ncbi:hypothetical protein Vadar_016189 [Vaccinium darrowii]|uniref:Uncharacterized protein n=1 Tax=Vaccinium darrowii TaxID=229202 RepID=A0ACB7X1M8_9ERIC|nr:hypothetical protein Vadar_016189 [Vaccinium darrowii]
MLPELTSRKQPCRKILSLLCFFSLISLSRPTTELQALLNFQTSLSKSPTNAFATWVPDQYPLCNFTGITCNPNHMVKEINLPLQNLSGTLPFDSICSLQSLEKISLGSNALFGSVTEDLSNCTNLKYLDLGLNSFTGKVPDLSFLTQLKYLNLNQSGFSGQFPWKSLENLTQLEFLSIGDNPFDRNPFPLEVLNLDKLYRLYLANCSIEGEIPEGIGNLTLLQNLEIQYNFLFGEIPEGITKLKNLWQLELYNNSLSGKLPVGFGNLTNLINFDASTNKLEGDLSEIKHLVNLVSLQLFENEFSGEVPVELGEFKSLQGLSIYRNKLTGSLPQKIGSNSDFDFIDVSENFLTGPIPPEMCKNGKMTELLIGENNFTGGIPENYASCLSLDRFRVNKNSLSGIVPAGIWSLPNLTIFDLTWNQFEGPLGSTIGEAKSLAQLLLAHNRFSGELPARIGVATSLVDIQLASNRFAGEVPVTIGNLKRLGNLHLENNLFSGPIPESLGSCVSLNDINLAGNSFSGLIPASIGSLRSLNFLNLSDNKLSGEIPVSLSSPRLSLLDLSNNQLTGRIPDSLSIEAFRSSFVGNPGLCTENLRNFRSCSSVSGKSGDFRTIISCLLAGATVLSLSLLCFMYVKCKPRDRDRPIKRRSSWDMKKFHVLSFSEEEIVNAITKENLIGKGGSGNVYRVRLGCGKQLAVKHIWKSDFGGRKSCHSSSSILTKGQLRCREFDAEVATLSSIRHVNVVKLYCSITSEDSNLLVYEYFSNDFGLAKVLQANGSNNSTMVIAGTHGYIAPEYAYACKVNEKSDVYSFGVVLMELVTGKKPVETEFGNSVDIVQWVSNEMRSRGSVLHLVDATISEAQNPDAARVLTIAMHCTMKNPALRPSMRMVVQMLEEAEPCELTGIVVNKGAENISGRYNWSDTYEKEAPSMEAARARVELEDSVSKKFYLY